MGWGSGNIGGGGTGLNFSVKQYANADNLPPSASENTIAIITSATITSWIFDTAAPADPANGMVWITVGNSSPVAFNALKKNGIRLYPITAKQYIAGSWERVEAVTYINGTWTEWATELILAGFNTKIMDDATCTLPTESSPFLDISATYVSSTKQGRCIAETESAHDLTDANKVVFIVDNATFLGNRTYVLQFYVASETQTDDWSMTYAKSVDVSQNLVNASIEIDVSDLSGYHFIGLYVRGSYSPTGTQSCKVSSLRIE